LRYDVVCDIVCDISRYDVVYDVVCDIVYDIERYDVVCDIVCDISRYDVVYDVVCDIIYDVIYDIVYFSVPWFGGVALPELVKPNWDAPLDICSINVNDQRNRNFICAYANLSQLK
jgi:hypothetical protein